MNYTCLPWNIAVVKTNELKADEFRVVVKLKPNLNV